MKTIEGTVESIIFENASNGYTICDISSENSLITVCGFLPDLVEGERIIAHGEWVTHPDYGEQFKADYYEQILPSTENDIEKYLASGILPHVGKSTAKKIVEFFGTDTLNVIEHTPEELLKIKGLSERKVQEIHQKYLEQLGLKEIIMFFQKFGISTAMAVKSYKVLGANTIPLVTGNPYILCDQVSGITFQSCDKIADTLGFPKNAPARVAAGIKATMTNAAFLSGHVYIPRQFLISNAKAMLDVNESDVNDIVAELLLNGKLISENMGEYDAIYLDTFFEAEKKVATKLKELNSTIFEIDRVSIDNLISAVETETNLTLADKQLEAVESILTNSVTVLTGGPGTGKTTTIKAIINAMTKLHKKIMLTAPTGRAAKRMSEVSGMDAKTIHRLLENCADDSGGFTHFAKNERNKLECDVLIVDETSMVDILLMSALLSALPIGARLVLVGDSNQLPSVGPGNVLQDIIDSESVLCVKLTEIFRQAKESMIVVNAHKINHGEYPDFNDRDNDFFLVKRNDPLSLCATISDLCKNRIPLHYGVDSISQIQVLTPTRKTEIGVQNLNTILQNALNPADLGKPEKSFGGYIYRLGDKVMQNKNNYNLTWSKIDTGECGLGVFNGDVGFITGVNAHAKNITVTFDDKTVKYDFMQLDELDLAYAITVHKSQGSEFDVVIMPMFETHRMLMNRNLLYTAITRAKKIVILVGMEDVIKKYVDNDMTFHRYSGLKNKLIIL